MTHSARPFAIHRRAALAGMAGAALLGRVRAAAQTTVPSLSLLDVVPPAARAAILAGRSGGYDCGPPLSEALARAPRVHLPAGRYGFASPVRFQPRFAGRFAPAPQITGDGTGATILEAAIPRAALFGFDSGATPEDFRAIRGLGIADMSITGRAAAAVELRGCHMTRLENLAIDGTETGVAIVCRDGDTDGSNMVALERVRIDNCPRWGIDAAAAPGHNEISYLALRHVFVQGCGTAGSGDPASGGMRWKGQVLDTDQCAFALNRNAGVFIPGQAGLAMNARLASTTFENNFGRHLVVTGIDGFQGENLQFYSNDGHRVEVAAEFRADRYVVRGVDIDGAVVRATAGNRPYSAFRMTGENLALEPDSVRKVIFQNFGYPGQVKAEGLLRL